MVDAGWIHSLLSLGRKKCLSPVTWAQVLMMLVNQNSDLNSSNGLLGNLEQETENCLFVKQGRYFLRPDQWRVVEVDKIHKAFE